MQRGTLYPGGRTGKHARGRRETESCDGGQVPPRAGRQHVYLFDIVASFCAGFYEHDIELLSPLLAPLGGDLSAQGHAERARWTHTQVWKDTPERERERETPGQRMGREKEGEKQRELNTDSGFDKENKRLVQLQRGV